VTASTRGPASLRARLVATSLLVSTLAAVVLVVGLQVLLQHTNSVTINSRLAARASAVEATVVLRNGQVAVLEAETTTLDQNVWIFATDGTLVDGRLPSGTLGETVRALAGDTGPSRRDVADFRLLRQPVMRQGKVLGTVVVAADQEPYETNERHSLWLSMILGAATVLLASGAAWVAASRSLRQVKVMAETADDWREHDLARRFDPGPGKDEITQLGHTLDSMLDRITEALLAERRLTDEIAHELRTPLSVIRAEADLARSSMPDSSAAVGLGNIVEAADRMSTSITTMLTVARARVGTERCTVGDVLDQLGLPCEASSDEVTLAAPMDAIVAAVRPIVDNAREHSASEPRVEVRTDDRHAVFVILDDGPGVAADDVETVFSPGHSSRGGSGLGLALSRRMAHAIGAEVTAYAGPGGRFEVTVPRP
jgi:two-component system OmpR family sensor kinase